MELNLKNKTALVTGASNGIGKAIKECLEKEGVKVINWDIEEGFDLMKDIPKIMGVDFLINNVGGIGSDETKWKLAMEKNYNIMVKMIDNYLTQNHRNAINGYPLQKTGRVITISSIYGKEKGHNPGFTAAKSAQIAYMKSLSGRYKGITFNTICPGHIDVGKDFPDKPEVIGKPKDVANIVTFLCSDKAKHINGSCIVVDGGVSHSF